MAEILTHEEFFERARKGEFMGAKVTLIQKFVAEEVIHSGYYDIQDELDGVWSVGGERHLFWEDTNSSKYGNKMYEVELPNG